MIDDWECVELARQGNETAWRNLFDRHFQALVRMTSLITGSIDSGHDFAQESLVRLLTRNIAHHNGSVRSYLSTIAYRLALKERTRRGKSVSTESVLIIDSALTPLDQIIKIEAERIAVQVIQSLPDEQKDVLTLRFYGDHSYEEISLIIGVPIGTVKSRLFYAVKKCTQQLRERGIVK
jgi:RNA polymerase sigma-70 factor (ECF subfamily)